MIDIKLIRENRELVKENIKKKFQDEKLPLVDEVYEMDKKVREVQVKADGLKADKNHMSSEIGKLMRDGKRDEAEEVKKKISSMSEEITALEEEQEKLTAEIKDRMMVIPQIMDPSVPIGTEGSIICGITIIRSLISAVNFSCSSSKAVISSDIELIFFLTSSASSLLPSLINLPISLLI